MTTIEWSKRSLEKRAEENKVQGIGFVHTEVLKKNDMSREENY